MSKNSTTILAHCRWFVALTFASWAFSQSPFEKHSVASELGSVLASDDGIQTAHSASQTPVADRIHFLEAGYCARCHSNSTRANAMRDAKQRPVAPYDLWRASMMANSARDPFWRAVLSAEVVATPSKKALIEEKCTRCHAPMAAPAPPSPPSEVLTYLKQSDDRSHLGLDGVSCTVCHQITDKGFGSEASFTGHFELNEDAKIFGPHVDPFTMPMQHHVGYTPTHSAHILESALCATCHTVNTTSVDAAGTPSAGEFHEQSPYLEWRNSIYNDEVANPDPQAQSCQACHMPTKDVDGNPIVTNLAHNPGGRDFPFLRPRAPFGRHTFPSANTFIKQILRDNADQLGVEAPDGAFDASIEQSRKFLETATATLELTHSLKERNKMAVEVIVNNLAGHKLPTAYPSRRVWIMLTVNDAAGTSVFTSGQYNANGELTDSGGEVLKSEIAGGPINPHRSVIDRADQVQVYETIMADAEGTPTFTLLRGAHYAKDNRLLPLGWKQEHADGPATQPAGIDGDENFIGGSDRIVYHVSLPRPGEYTVTAKLLFQVIAPRHADELFQFQTTEVKLFREMFERADRTPEQIATASMRVVDDRFTQ